MSFQLELPDAIVDAIAERAAQLVAARDRDVETSPWLSGAAGAAEYLGWPIERVYKHVRSMPHYRHGGRLMFRRDELDTWVELHRERP